ncbi:O-acetyl-ADP-ribose deacetylase [Roseibacillus persicicus]|uniref:O-acetyl-ADP-ribose deacetylase n=1 Tax=Roseibacillus persicicus TaxID=454148 RepID=UPI00398A5A3B
MSPQKLKIRSKLLSRVLRHDPSYLNIELDSHGWAQVDQLLERLSKRNLPTTKDDLLELVESNNKKRFRLSEDGLRIRANQGHSIDIDLQLEQRTPPPLLFHGTAISSFSSIEREGIQRRSRQHVHLSQDAETARAVGSRHGKPILLRVESGRMHHDGYQFFRSENGVWLTEAVPPRYFEKYEAPVAMPLTAIQADITSLSVDVIVNAANSSLLGGGGVDGAIHRAAGKELVHECRLLGGCKTGEAKATASYNLPCQRIIHTVGPVWQGGDSSEKEKLTQCYLNSLKICLAEGWRSIAFPCISTGVYNFPAEEAARIAVETCRSFSSELQITFCCFDEESLLIYRKLLTAD